MDVKFGFWPPAGRPKIAKSPNLRPHRCRGERLRELDRVLAGRPGRTRQRSFGELPSKGDGQAPPALVLERLVAHELGGFRQIHFQCRQHLAHRLHPAGHALLDFPKGGGAGQVGLAAHVVKAQDLLLAVVSQCLAIGVDQGHFDSPLAAPRP